MLHYWFMGLQSLVLCFLVKSPVLGLQQAPENSVLAVLGQACYPASILVESVGILWSSNPYSHTYTPPFSSLLKCHENRNQYYCLCENHDRCLQVPSKMQKMSRNSCASSLRLRSLSGFSPHYSHEFDIWKFYANIYSIVPKISVALLLFFRI